MFAIFIEFNLFATGQSALRNVVQSWGSQFGHRDGYGGIISGQTMFVKAAFSPYSTRNRYTKKASAQSAAANSTESSRRSITSRHRLWSTSPAKP